MGGGFFFFFDFADNNYIQFKFTCDGENLSPGLVLDNIPEGTKSLALIMDDTDSPNGEFVHWVMWNMPVKSKIVQNKAEGIVGKNTQGKNMYYGPCPPNGMHTYHFKVYALNSLLELPASSGKAELLKAIEGHIIELAVLKGRYSRKSEPVGK
ncbi:MAG: YbhB/YbcL family Raf kinase inhibitor-like protein [Sphingobacteriaceae bacterium]|nr:YbhB/YbcL family Raf kinase inhibitor-like protein [Sphingobacteriaceae bacterium]